MLMAVSLAAQAQVTSDTLLKAQEDPNSWLSYGRNHFGWRYSPLTQITTSNAAQLAPAWILRPAFPGTTRPLR